LTSMLPAEPPTLEAIFEQGRGDIGAEADQLDDLPPSPEEPRSGILAAGGRGARRVLAHLANWFANHVPAIAQKPTWVNRLQGWAQRTLAGIDAALAARRNREIARLLNLLKTDPDRGLRFAPPFGKGLGDAHRGIAPPSARLAERDTDFNLGRLGGGAAADFWHIEAEYRYQLAVQYRELANRELRLGRYRRAAYIFAELLGDLEAAASALSTGRHWREAAVLYRDRLNRPAAAAQCLEQGGLLEEAIALWESQGQHERAGDLWGKLQQHDRAAEDYRKAVAGLRARNDLVSAARVLDEKLHVPEEALAELERGWPGHSQATPCLRGVFRILAREGRHDTADRWVDRLRKTPGPDHLRAQLVDILAETATDYPHAPTRDNAADCTRVLASRRLPDARASERHQLAMAVGRLVPHDRLLQRDCQRYLGQRSPVARPRAPASPSHRVRLLRRIQLPQGIDWKKAAVSGSVIYAVGAARGLLTMARATWDGAVERSQAAWKLEPRLSDAPLILCADRRDSGQIVVHAVRGKPLTPRLAFPATARIPDTVYAGAFCGASSRLLGMSREAHWMTWLLEDRDGELTLVALNARGHHVTTHCVPLPPETEDPEQPMGVLPLPIHARSREVYVGLGNRLMVFGNRGLWAQTEYHRQITSVQGSGQNVRPRIAVGLTRGGRIYWDDLDSPRSEAFAPETNDPLVCINRGGLLVAVGAQRGEVYRTQDGRLKPEAAIAGIHARPIACLPAPAANQFALLTPDGEITTYEIP